MLVFVYGTLKLGNRLNPVLAKDTFICHTVTADKAYDLIGGSGFPWMVRSEDRFGYAIKGDLYDVSEPTLKRLDEIEGHPFMYKRESILVKNGEVDEEAFVYLAADETNRGNTRGIKVEPAGSFKSWSPT